MSKLYRIRPAYGQISVEFLCGKNDLKEQFLLGDVSDGSQLGSYLVVKFAADGSEIGYLTRPSTKLPKEVAPLRHDRSPFYNQQDLEQLAASGHVEPHYLRDYIAITAEFRIKESPIDVQEFFLADWPVGVTQYPTHLQDYLDYRDQYVDQQLEDALESWITQQLYVLWWGRDYYMEHDGGIDST